MENAVSKTGTQFRQIFTQADVSNKMLDTKDGWTYFVRK
jgi:hypothetical protein